ncbi:hypothetical protein AAG747_06170 [Rapidithrix thailandica]|uniref:Lipoprotein n=1 Tax=Rapidithrix thailandica TaxID=413964 RepID=A0AAW9S509_9BACT
MILSTSLLTTFSFVMKSCHDKQDAVATKEAKVKVTQASLAF